MKPEARPAPGVRLRVRLALLMARPERALALLDAALRQAPDEPWALASRSLLLARTGRSGLAIADAQALVEAHPRRRGQDWFNLGFLLESAGRSEAAADAFRRATDLSPALDRAWYGLGLALIATGRYAAAELALRRCAELQPLGPAAWYQLARLQAELGRRDEALALIRHVAGFEPAVARQLRLETGLDSPAGSR
jgi:tetratricopeptide (TPR) repeat protein